MPRKTEPKTKLAKIRVEKGLTREELAYLSEISFGTIRELESGRNNINNARAIIVYALATALKCKVKDILELD